MQEREQEHPVRIALTGGPGGGKTTALDLFRREMMDEVGVVPETATILFSGGFPRSDSPRVRYASQTAIYHVQRNLEDAQAAFYPGRILLCDRGTVDGAAYWPGEPEEFFSSLGTDLETEYARYAAVIFFESAAVGGASIEGNNPVRTENAEEAIYLNARIHKLWSGHPRFMMVRHNPSFFKKLTFGLSILESVVTQLRHENGYES